MDLPRGHFHKRKKNKEERHGSGAGASARRPWKLMIVTKFLTPFDRKIVPSPQTSDEGHGACGNSCGHTASHCCSPASSLTMNTYSHPSTTKQTQPCLHCLTKNLNCSSVTFALTDSHTDQRVVVTLSHYKQHTA